MAKQLELTLAILKPHVIPNIFAHKWIKEKIAEKGFRIIQSKTFRMDSQTTSSDSPSAGDFYAEHRKKFFYGRLVSFMSSGPVEVLILAKKNAINEWRALLGPTKVYKTVISHPDTLRGMFGLTDTRNVGHGSDSPETSEKEIKFFFPDFNVSRWLEENSHSDCPEPLAANSAS